MIRTFFIYCIVLLALLQVTSSSNFFNRNFKSSAPESSSSSNQDDDYYKILGLPRSASEREVKTAYRKRAMVMHPDKGGNEEEFKRLVEAYEVLSDQAKRKLYDKYGSKGLDGKSGFTDPSYMNNDFRDFFRGFSNFPVIYNLEIDLEDFFKGRSLTIVLQNEKFAVEIEPGMYEGTEIRGQIIDAAGNSKQIVLILQEKPHPLFRRKNADLYIECTISISEVLLGFERTLTHLDGSQFIIKSKEGELVAPEEVLVIEQLGMPIYKSNGRKQKVVERGRLFIKVKVEIPSKLSFTPEERQTLDKIFANKQNRSFQTSFIANKKKSSIPQFVPTKSDLRKFGGLGSYARDEETDDFTDFGSFFFR